MVNRIELFKIDHYVYSREGKKRIRLHSTKIHSTIHIETHRWELVFPAWSFYSTNKGHAAPMCIFLLLFVFNMRGAQHFQDHFEAMHSALKCVPLCVCVILAYSFQKATFWREKKTQSYKIYDYDPMIRATFGVYWLNNGFAAIIQLEIQLKLLSCAKNVTRMNEAGLYAHAMESSAVSAVVTISTLHSYDNDVHATTEKWSTYTVQFQVDFNRAFCAFYLLPMRKYAFYVRCAYRNKYSEFIIFEPIKLVFFL